MSDNNDIVTTSISISKSLFKAARSKAAREYRSFSQHISYLIDTDLKRERERKTPLKVEETAILPPPPSVSQPPGNSTSTTGMV
jgi:hypothetical protein